MKRTIALLVMALTAPERAVHAREIIWTASGSVTSAASSYGVTVGSDVSIRVSYQSAVLVNGLSALVFPWGATYMKTEFYGNIGLLTEVRVGSKVWQGWVATRPDKGSNVLLTESYDGGGASDVFTIVASSAKGGVFDLFPYSGGGTARLIQINLLDETSPAEFISGGLLPSETAVPSQITKGTGSVAAGTERINFTINPASVAVESAPARSSLTIHQTLGGITLGWPSEAGTTYRLEESDGLGGWQTVGTYAGTGNDLVVPLNPFTAHPVRRFYRVERTEPPG